MKKYQKIISIVFVLLIGCFFYLSIMDQANRNLARAKSAKSFTENDFIENTYQLEEIWERYRRKNDISKARDWSYIYLKVKDQPFKLSFGILATDFRERTQNKEYFLKHLKKGDLIRVKVNKADLALASKQELLKTLKDFFSGTHQEVEIYKLSIGDKLLFEQPITMPNFANRSFADIAIESNLLKLALTLAAVFAALSWISKLLKRRNR